MIDPRSQPIEYVPPMSAGERDHARVMIQLQRERANARDQRRLQVVEKHAPTRALEASAVRARACGCERCEGYRALGGGL